jgi:formiminotetrahydrofolate cyclodeaminase
LFENDLFLGYDRQAFDGPYALFLLTNTARFDSPKMKSLKNHTLCAYLKKLSLKDPVPGGGSAAALVGATAASLLCMVARYSQNRRQSKSIEKKIALCLQKSEKIRLRLLDLVDLDAQAYLALVKAPKTPCAKRTKALRKARAVPLEVCRLAFAAIQLTPLLVSKGNPYLLSDVRCAVEMLSAAFQSAMANVQANQE